MVDLWRKVCGLMTTRWYQNPKLLFILRILIGALFIFSGVMKIMDIQSFADSIATFEILPKSLISPTAIILPILEVLSGSLLIYGRYQKIAALAILCMMAVFITAQVSAMARGLNVDCGCFGGIKFLNIFQDYSLTRNTIIIAIITFIYTLNINFIKKNLFKKYVIIIILINFTAICDSNSKENHINNVEIKSTIRYNYLGKTLPLVSIYIKNTGDEVIQMKEISNRDIKSRNNEIIWSQYYPNSKIEPGQTVALNIKLKEDIESNFELIIKNQYNDIKVIVSAKDIDIVSYKAIRFGNNNKVYLYLNTKNISEDEFKNTSIIINSKEKKYNIYTNWKKPHTLKLIEVDVNENLEQGELVDIEIKNKKNNSSSKIITKVNKHFLLDSFGLDKVSDNRTRSHLNLDLEPSSIYIHADPSCYDKKLGESAENIISERKRYLDKYNNKLSYIHFCINPSEYDYSVYSQIADAIAISPYSIIYVHNKNFLNKEEHAMINAKHACNPNFWIWFPAVYESQGGRMIHPNELYLQYVTALGHGCLGINYFVYNDISSEFIIGYKNSKELLSEIKKINKMSKSIEEILIRSCPIDYEHDNKNGLSKYILISGHDSALIIIRNNDFISNFDSKNNFNDHFTMHKKNNIKVEFMLPIWFDNIVMITDIENMQKIKFNSNEHSITIDVQEIKTAKIYHIKRRIK